jgi:HPt (histidine-containing phosphotransfer) domain-containing protein
MLLGAFGEAREGLATGARDGNWPDMQRKLHTLAGASLYCGATALHGAAQRSEAMLKEGRVAEARPMLDLVLEEMARLETAAREGAGVEMPPDQGVDA